MLFLARTYNGHCALIKQQRDARTSGVELRRGRLVGAAAGLQGLDGRGTGAEHGIQGSATAAHTPG